MNYKTEYEFLVEKYHVKRLQIMVGEVVGLVEGFFSASWR